MIKQPHPVSPLLGFSAVFEYIFLCFTSFRLEFSDVSASVLLYKDNKLKLHLGQFTQAFLILCPQLGQTRV